MMMHLPSYSRFFLFALLGCAPVDAQFDSQSDGSDGALDFTGLAPGTVVEFDPAALAPPRDLDGDNIYHFTTITVPADVTVHLTAPKLNWAPVYWLASGAIEIAGTLDLNGGQGHAQDAPGERRPSIPGPGGFPGGIGADNSGAVQTAGLGPGGGPAATSFSGWSGSHATPGTPGTAGQPRAPTYGSPFLQPLQGGSGGGGAAVRIGVPGSGGGAGGGAILIASSASIQLDGIILSRGGNRGARNIGGFDGGGLGSGGAVRLIAPAFSGTGTIDARGLIFHPTTDFGGQGWIRVEALDNSFTGSLLGVVREVTLAENTPVLPTDAFPRLRVASIDGVAVSPSPTGSFVPPDLVIDAPDPVPVVFEAMNIPPGTELTVTVFNESEPLFTLQTPPLAGTLESSTTSVDVTFPSGFTRGWASATW